MDSALPLRIMSSRLFQAVGPANAKARLPNSSRVRGTMRWPLTPNAAMILPWTTRLIHTLTWCRLEPGRAVPCRRADRVWTWRAREHAANAGRRESMASRGHTCCHQEWHGQPVVKVVMCSKGGWAYYFSFCLYHWQKTETVPLSKSRSISKLIFSVIIQK